MCSFELETTKKKVKVTASYEFVKKGQFAVNKRNLLKKTINYM